MTPLTTIVGERAPTRSSSPSATSRRSSPSSARPVRVGCSGWQYKDWRGRLYPEGLAQSRWLSRYAEEFDAVEVNSTFYRLASRDAVARWVEQTPEEFIFAVTRAGSASPSTGCCASTTSPS